MRFLGAPNKLFCKLAVLQWVFLLGKLIQFYKMKCICRETFLKNFLWNGHYRRKAVTISFRTLDGLWKYAEIMDVRDETHIIHSCYAAGWEKHWCHLPGSEEDLLIYQGRQLCDDKRAPSVLVYFKLTVRCF